MAGYKSISIAVAALLSLNEVRADEAKTKCIALSLSGGGSKGAYEAGVLWGIYNQLQNKADMQYDIVTGVSAGSINTFATGLFAPGDEKNLVEFLKNAWGTLSSKQVFKDWPLGVADGILYKSGIYDDSPLSDFLYNLGAPRLPFKRKYVMTATNANTGNI